MRPEACIRYGHTLPGTAQRTLKPLELLKPYHVTIKAGGSSGTVAHVADFCLVPNEKGQVKVRLLGREESDGPCMGAVQR